LSKYLPFPGAGEKNGLARETKARLAFSKVDSFSTVISWGSFRFCFDIRDFRGLLLLTVFCIEISLDFCLEFKG
jgi:hypothetical protein